MTEMKKVIIKMPNELIERIDDYRFNNRFESRSETIRVLIDWALKHNPKIKRGLTNNE